MKKSVQELRMEGLQHCYKAARRQYEEAFFSGDPARLVTAWDAEQRAFSALLAFMAQPPVPQFAEEISTTRKVLDDSETDRTRPLPDLSDLEALNEREDPVSDKTSPLDSSIYEMTEADPVGPILRAMAQSQRKQETLMRPSVPPETPSDEETT